MPQVIAKSRQKQVADEYLATITGPVSGSSLNTYTITDQSSVTHTIKVPNENGIKNIVDVYITTNIESITSGLDIPTEYLKTISANSSSPVKTVYSITDANNSITTIETYTEAGIESIVDTYITLGSTSIKEELGVPTEYLKTISSNSTDTNKTVYSISDVNNSITTIETYTETGIESIVSNYITTNIDSIADSIASTLDIPTEYLTSIESSINVDSTKNIYTITDSDTNSTTIETYTSLGIQTIVSNYITTNADSIKTTLDVPTEYLVSITSDTTSDVNKNTYTITNNNSAITTIETYTSVGIESIAKNVMYNNFNNLVYNGISFREASTDEGYTFYLDNSLSSSGILYYYRQLNINSLLKAEDSVADGDNIYLAFIYKSLEQLQSKLNYIIEYTNITFTCGTMVDNPLNKQENQLPSLPPSETKTVFQNTLQFKLNNQNNSLTFCFYDGTSTASPPYGDLSIYYYINKV